MTFVKGFFKELHFSDSMLGVGEISNGDLKISIKGLFLTAGHPLFSMGYGPFTGVLIFEGVVAYKKVFLECIGDPQKPDGFKPPIEMNKVFDSSSSAENQYVLEGYQENPNGWVEDWTINARGFSLKLDKSS
jgi:hypothetical protein